MPASRANMAGRRLSPEEQALWKAVAKPSVRCAVRRSFPQSPKRLPPRVRHLCLRRSVARPRPSATSRRSACSATPRARAGPRFELERNRRRPARPGSEYRPARAQSRRGPYPLWSGCWLRCRDARRAGAAGRDRQAEEPSSATRRAASAGRSVRRSAIGWGAVPMPDASRACGRPICAMAARARLHHPAQARIRRPRPRSKRASPLRRRCCEAQRVEHVAAGASLDAVDQRRDDAGRALTGAMAWSPRSGRGETVGNIGMLQAKACLRRPASG